MNSETLNKLFDQGGKIIIPNAHPNLEIGIDYNCWDIDKNFKGIKLIPPGIHFIYYRIVNGNDTGIRSAFFYLFDVSECLVLHWDVESEQLINMNTFDKDQELRINTNLYELERYLGSYTLDPNDAYLKWMQLIRFINIQTIDKIQSHNTTDITQNLDQSELNFTQFDLKRSFSNSAIGKILTDNYLDKTSLLDDLIGNYYNNDVMNILAELQSAFIYFFLGQDFTAFEQWKKLIQLICSCSKAITKYPLLYSSFIDCVSFMIRECPSDLFQDILNEENLLFVMLQKLYGNVMDIDVDKEFKNKITKFRQYLLKKYGWDLECEFEDDEYKPVIVEE